MLCLHTDSPQREKSKSSSAGRVPDLDLSPPRRRPNTRRDSDSDLSPPRERVQGGRGSDSDLSPPRKRPQEKHGSDSDLSPPRRARAPAAQTVSTKVHRINECCVCDYSNDCIWLYVITGFKSEARMPVRRLLQFFYPSHSHVRKWNTSQSDFLSYISRNYFQCCHCQVDPDISSNIFP